MPCQPVMSTSMKDTSASIPLHGFLGMFLYSTPSSERTLYFSRLGCQATWTSVTNLCEMWVLNVSDFFEDEVAFIRSIGIQLNVLICI